MGPDEPCEIQQDHMQGAARELGQSQISTDWGMSELRAALQRKSWGYEWVKIGI